MARPQSSFAISAAFCSSAMMLRPESSAATLASGCPFGVGANGTIVAGLSGAYALMNERSLHYRCDRGRSKSTTSVAQLCCAHAEKFFAERRCGFVAPSAKGTVEISILPGRRVAVGLRSRGEQQPGRMGD